MQGAYGGNPVDKQPLYFQLLMKSLVEVLKSHNITGKFAVVQGNGGDIKMGLSASVMESDKKCITSHCDYLCAIQRQYRGVRHTIKKRTS
jgi:hypothetical protein